MHKRVFEPKNSIHLLGWLSQIIPTLKQDKKYRLEIKEHANKRSLDANNYAWQLMTKLADALTKEGQGQVAYTKDDVYLMMLKSYGQGGIAKIPFADVEKFRKAWKYNEEHEKLTDEKAAYYRFWVGSSNYSTGEMSIFINGIVAECREKDIPTETPEELARMVKEWNA